MIRRIGFFDERFITGGYDDADIMRRIIENNISIYESEEIIYYPKESTWNNSISRIYFFNKWLEPKDYRITRLLNEENYNYDIGVSNTNITFLDASYSIVMNGSKKWLELNIQYLKNS